MSVHARPFQGGGRWSSLPRAELGPSHIREVSRMTQLRSVMLADPVRTAIGTFGGSLKELPAWPAADTVTISRLPCRKAQ
jgi:hypothetical protein